MKHDRIVGAGDISLKEVANLLPRRRGKKVHYSTIYRWTMKGARGRVLESHMVGGVRYTTHAALRRFLDGDSKHKQEQPLAEELRQALYGSRR
ncbi:MAG: DUF1580 domain-containing protein [Planctomycetales bacterium]|nr:DUF1580 domain-containing protein [Planctomycetales bacterium]